MLSKSRSARKPAQAVKSSEASGAKKAEGRYLNDKMDGPNFTYFANGQKQSEQHWSEGERNGPSTVWDEQGNITRQQEFERGLPKRVKKAPMAAAESGVSSAFGPILSTGGGLRL